MNKKEALRRFTNEVLPTIRKKYEVPGFPDYKRRAEEWHTWVDKLTEAGKITLEQKDSWFNPFVSAKERKKELEYQAEQDCARSDLLKEFGVGLCESSNVDPIVLINILETARNKRHSEVRIVDPYYLINGTMVKYYTIASGKVFKNG